MTFCRVTEMVCDECHHTEHWDNTTEARANLWRRDGNRDLCPSCASKIAPPCCAYCGAVIVRSVHGKQPIYCHERCRWNAIRRRKAARNGGSDG